MKPVDLLQSPDIFTTVALAIMFDKYGSDFIEWDPLTVNIRLRDDFSFTPTQLLKDRIQAGCTILGTDMFYKSMNVFSVVSGIVGRGGYSTSVIIPPDTDEIAWTCFEARLLDEDFDPSLFIPEISRYVGFMLDREGIRTPPQILSFAIYPTEEEPGMGELGDDAGWMELYAMEQANKKDSILGGLKKVTLELLGQLEILEETGVDKGIVTRMRETMA